jgi:hypothetical protein
MCYTLYLATRDEQPLWDSPALSVEAIEPDSESVRQWFSLPVVRRINGHTTGCSCGFRYLIANEPVEYWEGMFGKSERVDKDQDSIQALVRLIREHVAASGGVEMHALWNDEVDERPVGTIELRVDTIDPQKFFLVEGFFYRVKGDDQRADT